MKRIVTLLGICSVVLFLSNVAQAQVTSASKLTWDQDAPDLALASSYIYKYSGDALAPVVLTGVTCTGVGSPFVCSAPFPAFSPGLLHSITLTAGNVAGDSLPSTPLVFTFVVVPSPPRNLRPSH